MNQFDPFDSEIFPTPLSNQVNIQINISIQRISFTSADK